MKSFHTIPHQFLNLSQIQHITHGPLLVISKASTKLLWFRDIIQNSFQIHLGKGTSIRFWEDSWLGDELLKDKYPRFYKVSSQQIYTISDMDV